MRTACKDRDIPVVGSASGSHVSPEAANIFKVLDVEHFIVACGGDAADRNGVERMVFTSGGWVYYLGGLAASQAPCEMLKPVFNSISGFSLKQRRMNG